MADSATSPFFSIIIPTRDRPDMLTRALDSVLDQTFGSSEVLVVVDGSSDDNLVKYRTLQDKDDRVQFFYLPHRPDGHGQSYSMNVGAREAQGRYLCFLDDDDSWQDSLYLELAHSSLSESSTQVDVHYSNQWGYFSDGSLQTEPVWLEDLLPQVNPANAHINGTYFVDTQFLLKSNGFGHLNCSIFLKSFYVSIGGMDESIRYENDREVYIRAIDRAERILYSTRHISRHNIPDVSKKENMSTIASHIEKKLYQIRVYDKGICMGIKREIKRHCKIGKTYELKHISDILAEQGDYPGAFFYAREALMIGFNIRWLLYTLYLGARSVVSTSHA